jgi:RNA polymerase sigma-70 factor (ECF subfamily)
VVAVAADVAGAFARGEPDAVRAVFKNYGKLVYAVAFKVLGDRSLADEATQETFVRAWRGAASYDPARDLGPWLATIARRTAIDVFRRNSRRAHAALEEDDPGLVELPPSVERAYDIWEVRRALAQLPPEDAALVRLQHLDGLTQAEVAKRLGLALGTVKSRTFRAHRQLARLLGHLRDDELEPPVTTGRKELTEEPPR